MKLFFGFFLAVSSIASSSAGGETFIWSADTPIYHAEMVGGSLKIIKEKSNFEPKKAVHSGNPDALFPKLLIFTDNLNYKKKNSSELIAIAKDMIETMNANFSTIRSERPLEVLLAGIVITQDAGIYDGTPSACNITIGLGPEDPSVQMSPISKALSTGFDIEDFFKNLERCCRRATAELKAFSEWIQEHEDQFEDLHAHVYFFLSTCWLVDDNPNEKEAWPVSGLTDPTKEICKTKPIVVAPSPIGPYNVVFTISFSLALGVSDPRDKPGAPYYTNYYYYSWEDKEAKEWKAKTAEVLNVNSREDKYLCFHDSDDQDYD